MTKDSSHCRSHISEMSQETKCRLIVTRGLDSIVYRGTFFENNYFLQLFHNIVVLLHWIRVLQIKIGCFQSLSTWGYPAAIRDYFIWKLFFYTSLPRVASNLPASVNTSICLNKPCQYLLYLLHILFFAAPAWEEHITSITSTSCLSYFGNLGQQVGIVLRRREHDPSPTSHLRELPVWQQVLLVFCSVEFEMLNYGKQVRTLNLKQVCPRSSDDVP